MRKYLFLPLVVLGMITLFSCEKEVDESASDELLRLQAYMSIHYPDAQPTQSGLYMIIEQEGTGANPSDKDFLLYDYTGRNLDDLVFETTLKSTAKLNELYSPRNHYVPGYAQGSTIVKGLKEGLMHLKEGSIAKFIMPSKLAYGNNRYGNLTPYSSVIFDVELKKIISDPEIYEQQQIEEYISVNYPELDIADAFVDSIYILEKGPSNELAAARPDSIYDKDIVKLYYTGTFFDDWVFDSNVVEVAKEKEIYDAQKDYLPITVEIGGSNYIKGFSLALKNLETLTNAKIIIPSKFAYGERGSSTIQPHTPLVFELKTLVKTSPKPKK